MRNELRTTKSELRELERTVNAHFNTNSGSRRRVSSTDVFKSPARPQSARASTAQRQQPTGRPQSASVADDASNRSHAKPLFQPSVGNRVFNHSASAPAPDEEQLPETPSAPSPKPQMAVGQSWRRAIAKVRAKTRGDDDDAALAWLTSDGDARLRSVVAVLANHGRHAAHAAWTGAPPVPTPKKQPRRPQSAVQRPSIRQAEGEAQLRGSASASLVPSA